MRMTEVKDEDVGDMIWTFRWFRNGHQVNMPHVDSSLMGTCFALGSSKCFADMNCAQGTGKNMKLHYDTASLVCVTGSLVMVIRQALV